MVRPQDHVSADMLFLDWRDGKGESCVPLCIPLTARFVGAISGHRGSMRVGAHHNAQCWRCGELAEIRQRMELEAFVR